MIYFSKTLTFTFLTLFLVACGGGTVAIPEHLKENFQDTMSVNFDADPKLNFYEQRDIRYAKYVDSDLKLSEGLLTPYFTKLMKKVLTAPEFRNRRSKILVSVDFKGYSAQESKILKEIKYFIKKHKRFAYKYSKSEIQTLIEEQQEHRQKGFTGKISNLISQETDLILKIKFRSNDRFEMKLIPVRGAIVYFDETVNLQNIVNGLSSKWAEVKVPDNMGNVDTYMIMKNSVTQAQFKRGDGSSKKAITNVGYAKAKAYCENSQNGASLTSIYVFEYARRAGLIRKPFSPGNEEMIEGYSSEFDEKYCNEADVLSLRQKKYNKNCKTAGDIDDMAEDDESIEISGNEIILFDWSRYQYWGASKNHTGANITFRCMRQK